MIHSFLKKLKKNNVEAFTLLEVLASLAIVTLVILGPISSAVNSASFARQTKDVMTSTYLAEEALEMLHYQYDSLYLQCANNQGACLVSSLAGETPGEKSWRLFKERLAYNTSPYVSCFTANGCSYDFIDLLSSTSVDPIAKYSPAGDECRKLARVSATVGEQVINKYVCSGIPSHNAGPSVTTAYSRSVTVESKQAFFSDNSPSYNDDLLITAKISFRRSNGILRTIQVVDFLHARS